MRSQFTYLILIPLGSIVLLAVAAYVVTRIVLPRVLHGMETRAEAIRRHEQCACGYPLKGLDVARCPECGRVVGFDATPEQLGLTHEELTRIQQKRQHRSDAQRDQA